MADNATLVPACHGKVRHQSHALAMRAVESMLRRHATNRNGRRGKPGVYRCWHCGCWHIGGSKRA